MNEHKKLTNLNLKSLYHHVGGYPGWEKVLARELLLA